MAVKFDPILNKLRQKDIIKQLDADPSSPKAQDAWVLKTATGGGDPIGLLLTLTNAGTMAYKFSYRTLEGTTVRADLT